MLISSIIHLMRCFCMVRLGWDSLASTRLFTASNCDTMQHRTGYGADALDHVSLNEVSGRCYCGRTSFSSVARPTAVAYCHCTDCRRVTGAPVAAFAAFDEAAVTWMPDEGQTVSINAGVRRSFCRHCGSPLTGRYDYLPGTVYVPLGILDQANALSPQLHAHHSNRLDWLCISDELERVEESAQSELRHTTGT